MLADLVKHRPARSTALTTRSARPRSVHDALQSRRLRIDANNEVQVYILMGAVTDDTVRQLTDAGVTIEIRDAARRRVQAHLPVSRLTAVAQLAWWTRSGCRLTRGRAPARRAPKATRSCMPTPCARSSASTAPGVRVGVVSDGIKGVFATGCTTGCAGVDGGPIATGDLPAATGVRNAAGVLKESSGGIVGRSFSANGDLEGLPPASPACSFAGAGAEGTALLEIVHDLAPGAKLSFANGDTDLAFNQAVNFLAASNDVVARRHRLLRRAVRRHQRGVDQHRRGAQQPGLADSRLRDRGRQRRRRALLSAPTWTPASTARRFAGITTPGHLHLFQRTADTTDVLGLGAQPFNVIALPQNGEVAIFLTWDDPFGGSANNYDLYLVQQSTGRVVASSTDVQSGRQDPSEVIDYVNRGAADRFLIVVQNVRGAAQPQQPEHLFVPAGMRRRRAGAAGAAAPRAPQLQHRVAQHLGAGRRRRLAGERRSAVGAICSASASAPRRSRRPRRTSRASTRRIGPRSSSAAADRRSTAG